MYWVVRGRLSRGWLYLKITHSLPHRGEIARNADVGSCSSGCTCVQSYTVLYFNDWSPMVHCPLSGSFLLPTTSDFVPALEMDAPDEEGFLLEALGLEVATPTTRAARTPQLRFAADAAWESAQVLSPPSTNLGGDSCERYDDRRLGERLDAGVSDGR